MAGKLSAAAGFGMAAVGALVAGGAYFYSKKDATPVSGLGYFGIGPSIPAGFRPSGSWTGSDADKRNLQYAMQRYLHDGGNVYQAYSMMREHNGDSTSINAVIAAIRAEWPMMESTFIGRHSAGALT